MRNIRNIIFRIIYANHLQLKAKWTVWYRDTFDYESQPSVDVRGTGLLNGLKELWARHFFESIQADGQQGFSNFYLETEHKNISIAENMNGSKKIRYWLFENKKHTTKGYVSEADPFLLDLLAFIHASNIDNDGIAETIVDLAAQSKDRNDFENRISKMINGA